MSEFRIDKITNRVGDRGTAIAGITTFSGTSGMIIPSGNDNCKKLPEGYVFDRITFYIDVSNSDSYTLGSSSITDIIGGTKDAAFHGAPAYERKDGVPSLYFDGSDDGIRMDTADGVAGMATGDPISMSTWVNIPTTVGVTGSSDWGAIMSMQKCNDPSFQLWHGSGGAYTGNVPSNNQSGYISFRTGWGDQYVVDSGKPDDPTLQVNNGQPDVGYENGFIDRRGSWMNLVGTYEGVISKLYVNGKLLGTCKMHERAGYTLRTPTDTLLSFMNRHPCGAPSWLKGWFHMASVHRKLLSDAEVLQNYNALKGRFGL